MQEETQINGEGTGYFDLSEATQIIERQSGVHRNIARHSIEQFFTIVAQQIAQDRPVVINNVGTFEIVYHQPRRWFSWLSPKREGQTPGGYRIRFRAAEEFKKTLTDALPEDLKHIPVL